MDIPERILREFRTIGVVGVSRDPSKAAHSVPRALQAAGFDVIPINPHVDELLGERVFRTLADVGRPIEVVLVFRPSAEAEAVARDAARIGAKALWLQLGIHSEAARKIAEDASMLYVEDRCIGVERAIHRVTKT